MLARRLRPRRFMLHTGRKCMAKKQIVILGGGFGGVYTARCLEKLLRPTTPTFAW